MTRFGALAVLATLALAGCSSSHPGAPLAVGPPAHLPPSRTSHVVVIVMENKEYEDVIGAPRSTYLNALATRYGVASDDYAITHPSLPNYLALTAGSTFSIDSDCTDCHVAAANLVDQLERAHVSWKAYLEDMPSPCFLGAAAGEYAKKHNPFVYYDDIVDNPGRCRKLVPYTQLAGDLRAGTLPTFAWISPNLCDDTHDCPVSAGDHFLSGVIPSLLAELGPHGFIVITWDEGSSDRGCCRLAQGGHIAALVLGPDVRAGARDSAPVDHYGVLATIEQALGLGPLAKAADPSAGSLDPLFVRAPRVR